MLKNDTLKNGTSRIGLYGSVPPGDTGIIRELKQTDAAAKRRRSHSNLHSIQESE